MYGLQFSNITEQGKANAFKVGSPAHTLLGSNLLGLQVGPPCCLSQDERHSFLDRQLGNEPDLFPGRRRGDDYTMSDWFGEIGQFMTDWQASGSTTSDQGLFYLPSSCCRRVVPLVGQIPARRGSDVCSTPPDGRLRT